MPSLPLYHWSTHCWQPIRFLQHLENMTGGIMGVPWQIVHLKVSIIIFFTPSGTFVILETSKRLAMSPLMVLTSLAIRSILSLLFLVKGIKSLSSPDESDETVITFFVSPSRTAYIVCFHISRISNLKYAHPQLLIKYMYHHSLQLVVFRVNTWDYVDVVTSTYITLLLY